MVALATPSEPLLQAVAPGTEASEVQRLLDEGGKEAREKGGSLRVQLERPYQVVCASSAPLAWRRIFRAHHLPLAAPNS